MHFTLLIAFIAIKCSLSNDMTGSTGRLSGGTSLADYKIGRAVGGAARTQDRVCRWPAEPELEGVVLSAAEARKRARDEAYRSTREAVMFRAFSGD
jgi:hypothetical protein